MHKSKHTTLAALLVLALAGLLALPMRLHAAGTIVYVDASASGTGDGSSWADAYPSLADALAGAASGTEIWVAKGAYKPTSGTDRTATFQLMDGVAIYGGFAGSETQRDQRDWQTNVTTLSGDIGTAGATSDNSYHVVTGATGATLDGVTIAGGNATSSGGNPVPQQGGGMYNDNSSPTLANVIFSGNSSGSVGGGLYNNSSSPTLTHVIFSGNSSGSVGGGLYNINNSNGTLTDVTFSGNSTSLQGGGMFNHSSSPTLTDVIFSGNSVASGNGGGMYNGGSPTLTNVTFIGNSTFFAGGGMYSGGGSATLTNVTFSGNSATAANGSFGGGMFNETGSATLTNVTISGNSATNGGGMANFSSSNPQVRNSILWGNGASNVYNSSSTPVFSASIVQGAGGSGAPWNTSFGTDGGGNLDVNPLFVSNSDLHLGPGSPAINAGNNSFLPASVTTDLDGNPRIVGGAVDMGAYEAKDTMPPDTTINSMPPNPTSSTSAAFSFSGSDDLTPAANLTFACALDGASFASCTSPTSYSNLAAGSHTFQVRAIDGAGNVDPTPASYSWTVVSDAPTTLLYNGGQIVNVGSSFTPAALLSSSAAACLPGQVVSFALDANPLTGAAGAYALGTATANSSGQATMPTVNTTGWLEGVYTISARFAGTPGCLPSSDSATLTVASPGAAANGGGWYTLSGSGRINFGFTLRKADSKCTSNCTYKGQLLLINNGKWRVKGNMTTYSKTSTGQGAASGTGNLYWWDARLNGGLGDWALAQSGVSYTVNFYDSGTSGKSSSDTFGIRIVYTPVAPQPSALPNSTPQLLKGGDIKVS